MLTNCPKCGGSKVMRGDKEAPLGSIRREDVACPECEETKMASWLHPENATVTGEVGDRLLMLVHERNRKGLIEPRIVTITATEDGWESDDPMYQGYGPGDSLLCIWENDFCRELAALMALDGDKIE